MYHHKTWFSLSFIFVLYLCSPKQVIGQIQGGGGGIKSGQLRQLNNLDTFSSDPYIARRIHGDIISRGTGLRATGPSTASGTITISGIPPGSTVLAAYLYWATLGDGNPPPGSDKGKLNGEQITGTLIGSDVSPCWDPTTIHSFFANVTNFVPGNGIYNLSDFADSGDPNFSPSIEGASLTVVFYNSSLPLKDITIYHGCSTVNQSSDTANIQGFQAASPVTDADLTMIVADGQAVFGDFDDGLIVNSVSLGSNNFEGDDGFLWDNDEFDITTLVPANSTSVPVTLSSTIDPSTNENDCLTWVAAALSVSSAPFKDPLHEEAQACMVDANQGCLLGFSTLIPYLGSVTNLVDLVTDWCDAGARFSIGDTAGGVIKAGLVFVDTVETNASILADIISAALPPTAPVALSAKTLANLIVESVDCVEGKLHEFLVELCDGYTRCISETIKKGFDAIQVNALAIFGGSPVTMEVFDESGKRIFIDGSGDVNAEIPDSWLYRLEDNRQLFLINNPEGQYEIVISGLPEAVQGDTFDLGIVLSSDESQEIIYEGVPTQAGSKATLTIGKQITDFNLQVDIDGDGNVDTTIPPTSEGAPNLQPGEITFNPSTAVVGGTVFFDSGVRNTGDVDTSIFNIQWLVNGQDVGAAGSHAGVPAGQTVLDGNSQFSWTFDSPGTYSVSFTVDFDNQIEESNEGDNSTTIDVVVDQPTDSPPPPPPPPPPFPDLSCTELFGSAPEFVLCEETETTCSFNARTDGGTCDQMCASLGSTCVGAINNDESCEELPDNNDTCETPRNTEICICER